MTWWPASSRWRVMGRPMAPSPTNPSCMLSSSAGPGRPDAAPAVARGCQAAVIGRTGAATPRCPPAARRPSPPSLQVPPAGQRVEEERRGGGGPVPGQGGVQGQLRDRRVPPDQFGERRGQGGRVPAPHPVAVHHADRLDHRPSGRSGTWPALGMLTGSSRRVPGHQRVDDQGGQFTRRPGLEVLGAGQPGVDVGHVPVLVPAAGRHVGQPDVVGRSPTPTPRSAPTARTRRGAGRRRRATPPTGRGR